ncbi:MAG: phytoene desaturase family protein [Peptostreptococcaceae bacterium]
MKTVVVIGAGIGGLCTAIRLLNKGYKVTILEKENTIGGKCNIKNIGKFKFDLTASILMTPNIYTDIFKECNKNYRDYFTMKKLETLYKVNYCDGTNLSFYNDLGKTSNTLEKLQKGLSIEYIEFLAYSLKKYLIGKEYFLDKPMTELSEILNLKSIKNLIKMNPFSTTSSYIANIISNKKLREYLIFQSMYIGVNPYTNSNIYTLIPAISQVYGLWYIEGGFYQYIRALEQLVYDLGGNIKTNTKVEEIIIHRKRAKGIKTNKGNYNSDIVICNADFPYSTHQLIKYKSKKRIKEINDKEYSCSVFMIYLGLNKKYKELEVHNIYINKEFEDSMQAAFKSKLPKYPSVYMYCPSKIDESLCPKGKETLNIMVRVPNLYYKDIKWSKKFVKYFRNIIINEIKQIKGLEDIEDNIIYESYLTPIDLKNKFNSYYGTAFGLSHKLDQTVYFRPHIKDKKIKNLYFIGSSTHPGNGVSVIIEGSKTLTNLIQK